MPVLRLRADAVHTANLRRSPKCSLFVQPGDRPAKLLARCTIIGEVKQLDEESSLAAAERHEAMHPFGIGVDAPQDTDLYFSLHLLWIDELGLYAYAKLIRQDGFVIRVPFLRPVTDERDARSTLTMLAQVAWEHERSYTPVMPELVGASS
ncbi:hypothetical protein WJX79_004765 [Trebouxia sp. C0005]